MITAEQNHLSAKAAKFIINIPELFDRIGNDDEAKFEQDFGLDGMTEARKFAEHVRSLNIPEDVLKVEQRNTRVIMEIL